MRIAVLGAGRVGTAMALLWQRAGHQIVGVSGRDHTSARVATFLGAVPVLPMDQAAVTAEVGVIAVPDDAIVSVAGEVRPTLAPGTWLGHLSGARGLDVLGPWPRRFAMHPLQTFPDVERGLLRMAGAAAAITAEDEEGFALGETLARDVGAVPFRLREEDRALYHAAAVFASNHVVATSAIAERLFAAAGVPDPLAAMAPLQRATIDNVASLGPAAALTGPAVRGDAATISSNLRAVSGAEPGAVAVYVAMCRSMAELAERTGRLDDAGRAAIEEALAPWF